MKIALVGAGKTGSEVAKLLSDPTPTIFNSKNKPTLEALYGHDLIICFLPGTLFLQYIDLFVESKLPVVTGSTGFDWPNGINQILLDKQLKWVWSSNFSLGMTLVQQLIATLNKAPLLFEDFKYDIHEIHHLKKLDAPSGTALKWRDWLGQPVEVTSSREGDVVGIHELNLAANSEEISIKHIAKDRSIFARGAIWAATKIFQDEVDTFGLIKFEDLAKKYLFNSEEE